MSLINNNVECNIKKININLNININNISNYLEYFNGYKNFKFNDLESSFELLTIINIINKNDFKDNLKLLNSNLIKDKIAINYLNSINILDILNNYNDSIIQNNSKINIINDIITKYLYNLELKNIFNYVIKYNLKFYIPILNKKIKRNYNECLKYFLIELNNLINNNKLDYNNIILDIYYYNDEKTINTFYKDIYDKLNIDNYKEYEFIFKILLNNKLLVVNHIILNLFKNNRYYFDYIYEKYENDFIYLLDMCKENSIKYYKNYISYINNDNYNDYIDYFDYNGFQYHIIYEYNIQDEEEYIKDFLIGDILKVFIIKNVFKEKVLINYINNNKRFKITALNFVDHLINDPNIPLNILTKIIKLNHVLLFDLIEFFKNIEYNIEYNNRYNCIKSFVYNEYCIINGFNIILKPYIFFQYLKTKITNIFRL